MCTLIRLLFLTLVLIFIPYSIIAQDFGKISEEHWNTQTPEDYPAANAVIIFDHADMVISVRPNQIKTERHVRIKIFNRNGADDALTVEIPYSEGDKIKALKAHTVNVGGKKAEVKKFYTKRIGTYKIKTFTFPAVEDGAILEYKYLHTHQRFTFLDPWHFQNKI